MQLTQPQLAQVVSSAVSQALAQHMRQTVSNPPLPAAASIAAVQRTFPEMPPPTRRAEIGASATFVEVRSTLRTKTVAYAEAWSNGVAIVGGKELRRVRCWST